MNLRRGFRPLGAVLVYAALAGCATVAEPVGEPNPADPWEGMNRKVFAFNDALDDKVLKPTATVYEKVVPTVVRDGVNNFFNNLTDAWSAANWLLQGEISKGVAQGARFAWNSTIGVAGVWDASSYFGLDRNSQDFGQTLGAWGVGMGPYLVLPLVGPSSVRDTVALPVNRLAGSSAWFHSPSAKLNSAVLDVVSTRASLLKAGDLVDGIALDKYTFFRDAYLQRRAHRPKADAEEDDFELAEPSKPAPAP